MDNKRSAELLQRVELFKFLPQHVLIDIAKKAKIIEAPENKTLFLKGDEGDGLYIITSGLVDIIDEGKTIAKLQEGDFFGELALINDAPRSASAITKAPCTLLFIDKETFNRVAADMPVIYQAAIRVVIRYLRQESNKKPIETQ